MRDHIAGYLFISHDSTPVSESNNHAGRGVSENQNK
jgi:hypothetical protein